jgi:hypothetical protein
MRSITAPLIFLIICSLLAVAGAADPVMTGSFAPEGAFVGCTWPAPGRPAEFATWGSHSGNDDLTGEFILVPFVLQGPFDLWIAGYPGHQNNRLELLIESEGTAIPMEVRFQPAEPGERITMRPPSHVLGPAWRYRYSSPRPGCAADDARNLVLQPAAGHRLFHLRCAGLR